MSNEATQATPLVRLQKISRLYPDVDIWAKLDSNLDGGSKARVLEQILRRAKADGALTIVLPGTIRSNFALTLARGAAEVGISVRTCLVNSTNESDTFVQERVRLLQEAGAKFTAVKSRTARLIAVVGSLWNSWLCRHTGLCVLPIGGASVIGCRGGISAALELKQQIDAGEMSCPDIIFAPVGSGGLVAGLYAGLVLAGVDTKLVGISTGKGPGLFLVRLLAYRTLRYWRQERRKARSAGSGKVQISISREFECGGYAVYNDELIKVIEKVYYSEGILLDPVYTGKVMMGLLALIEADNHKGTVLFWDTRPHQQFLED